jgi:hypothetical protein
MLSAGALSVVLAVFACRDATVGSRTASATLGVDTAASARVPPAAPDFFPKALFDSLGTVRSASRSGGTFRKDIVTIDFRIGTPAAVRQAIVDSIGGVVVGGAHYTSDPAGTNGTYYVRIHGGTMATLLAALDVLHRQPAVVMAGWWELTHPDENAHRR